MKEILLRPQIPYVNHLEIDVLDFPKGVKLEPRWRCTITVDYGTYDIDLLKSDGMDLEACIEHYRKRIYDLVRARLLDEWTPIGGQDEALDIIKSFVTDMF